MRRDPTDESAKLVVRDGWDGADRVLVDPSRRNSQSSHTAIDFAHPSPDGRYVAYGVSTAGSENDTIEIIEVESGRILPDRIDRTQQPRISWRPDGRSFFYWRRAEPNVGATPAEWYKGSATFLHIIGKDPGSELPVIGAPTRELGIGSHYITWVEVTPGSRWALAGATPGPADPAYYVAPLASAMTGNMPWRRVAGPDDKVAGMLIRGDRLYAFTYTDAPNYRIVFFDAKTGNLSQARDFVSESELVLEDFALARDAMYVVALDGASHRLFRISWQTGVRQEIKLPFEGSIRRLVANPEASRLMFKMEGWTHPPSWFVFETNSGLREWQVSPSRPLTEHLVTEQVTAISRDGTEVPLSIIRRKEHPSDGTSPALLSGYGAYGLATTPTYNPFTLTWVKRGGLYAFCHTRGGGERGKAWHVAGKKENKENGVDDFIACAEHLIGKRYTTSGRLTATGISAGGILVGGAITKRPDLFKAAILRVPVVNLLRNEVTPAGPRNTVEYGSVKSAGEFRNLLASDPYYRVRDEATYPAVLLTAGLHDVRVAVWQPAKFAARLQAGRHARPTLLRVDFDAGHSRGSTQTQREEEFADIYAFALWQSGLTIE
jgi:prolyl oligopeptidase